MATIAAKFNKFRQDRKAALEKRKKEREERKAKEREKMEKEDCAAYEETMKQATGYLIGSPDSDILLKDLLKKINICYGYAEDKTNFLTKTGNILEDKLVGKNREPWPRKDSERTIDKITAKNNLITIMRSDPPEYDWYAELLEKWPDQKGGKKRKSRRKGKKSRRKRKRTRRRRRKKGKKSRRRRRR
tara:strand:- start:127 stop:690 length:564 start_codon:yes stop_codon:yes gene_type:complete